MTPEQEQPNMSKDDVPEDVLAAIKRIVPVPVYRTHCGCEPPGHDADCRSGQTTFQEHTFADAADTRLVAGWLRSTHEPAPVDPLREVAEALWPLAYGGGRAECVDRMTEELRARGVTATDGPRCAAKIGE